MSYLGDFPDDFNAVIVFFNTFDSNDPSGSVIVSDFLVADVAVYKDGGTTQRSSTAGFTLLDTDGINFDGLTGVHGVSINLADNTDAGFFATGSEYSVIIGPVTVDGAAITFEAASFSIERAGGALATALLTNTVVDGIAAQLAGITLLNEWLGAIMGKQNADATALTEIRAAGAGSGTYDPNTDSTEAIRDTAPMGSTMVGTDNAALASVLGALDDVAAAGDPTSADTVMDYIKQLVNLLAGSAGIGTMPSAADPANGVNLFEMLRAAMGATFATATDSLEQLQGDIGAIPTTAMRGTDSAATAASLATLTDALVLTSATIETVTDQTNFIIPATADATDDDAYNDALAVFIDGTDPNQKSFRRVTDYAAGTRSVKVDSAPDFTVTNSDTLAILAIGGTEGALKPTTAGRTLDVSAGGEAGLDWANIGTKGSTVDLSDTTIKLCDTTTASTNVESDLDNATDGLGALKALLDTLIVGVVVKTMNTDVNDAVSVDADVWAEILDLANGVDTGLTLRQFFRLVAASTFGKASGLATTTAIYRNIPDDVDAITATVDADGNRSAVTLDSS